MNQRLKAYVRKYRARFGVYPTPEEIRVAAGLYQDNGVRP